MGAASIWGPAAAPKGIGIGAGMGMATPAFAATAAAAAWPLGSHIGAVCGHEEHSITTWPL
eukprot:1152183-Pelagomonas_calceolata.AAC.1